MMGSQIFISYSHRDKRWLEKLKTTLKPLERRGEISVFSDKNIEPGANWRVEIQQKLYSAKVAILLVSPAFLASDFIDQHELKPLLKAAEQKRLTIFWIAVRHSTYTDTDIKEFQAANDPDRPLASLRKHEVDRELVCIYEKVKAAIQRGRRKGRRKRPPPDGPPRGDDADVGNGLDVGVALHGRSRGQSAHIRTPLPSSASTLAPRGPLHPGPYQGLKPFDESRSDYFHGRSDEIRQMLEAIDRFHFLMVLGPSGSGKSSLVFAGLLPELKKGMSPWEVLTLRPQQAPAANLNRRLPGVLEQQPEQPEKAVARHLASSPDASRLLLIIDQFEECFTQATEEEREKLFDVLQRLRKVKTCTIVLTLRAVFLEDLMLSKLWPAEESDRIERIEITPLRGDKLREAIVKPAEAAHVTLDPGLVELLLADAAGEPGRLPLLQTTLEFLWDKIRNGRLPLEAYTQLGGEGRQRVAHALGRKAVEALDSLSPDEQRVAHRPFLRLIQFVEGRPETRRQQPLSALHDGGVTQILVERTVNQLADHGLLVMDRQRDDKLVDLAHEALITAWPTLRDWIAQWREPEQERRRWESKAAEWLGAQREKYLLLDNEPLRRLEEWLKSPGAASVGHSRTLAEFAQASRKASAGVRAEELAKQAADQLERNPDLALRLAMEAVSMTWEQGQPPVASAEDALRQALVHTPVRRILHGHRGEVLGMAVSGNGRLLATTGADSTAKVWDVASGHLKVSTSGHTGSVVGIAFDPGEASFATAGGDSTVRIWSLSHGGLLSALTGHEGIVTCVAYSPAGDFLISGGEDATARIWDLSTQEVRLELRGHRRPIRTVAFNANGTRVVTAGDDAVVRIWSAVDGEEIQALLGHVNRVWDVSWEALSGSVATAGEDRTVRIWDAVSGVLRLTRQRHEKPVRSVRFDSSGGLLTASEDGTVRIWGTQGGEVELVRTLRSPGTRFVGAAYGQSGTEGFVLATGADGATRLWKTTDGHEIVAHRFDDVCPLGDALFSPAGLRGLLLVPGSASTSTADYAQVWELESGTVVITLQETTSKIASTRKSVGTGAIHAPIPNHASGVNHAEYSPDGRFLATASRDRTGRIWNASSGEEVRILKGHKRPVRRISWSPDGRWVVTASEDRTARIWDAATGRELHVLKEHTGSVYAAVFSPSASPADGLRIATASADGTMRIWESATGTQLQDFHEHSASVNDVVWSPDGLWVATASKDGTARIWNLETGRSEHVLRGHERSVLEIAWSPDGRTLATAGEDRTVRLWDAATGERRSVLRGHTAEVVGVVFSPDGRRVVSTGRDRTIRQYLVAVEDLLAKAEARNPIANS